MPEEKQAKKSQSETFKCILKFVQQRKMAMFKHRTKIGQLCKKRHTFDKMSKYSSRRIGILHTVACEKDNFFSAATPEIHGEERETRNALIGDGQDKSSSLISHLLSRCHFSLISLFF